MKVLIDIDKKLYDRMKTYHGLDDAYFSIKHGIPLDDFMCGEVDEEESIHCDSNICIRNDYNDIDCEDCEVTKRRKMNDVKELTLTTYQIYLILLGYFSERNDDIEMLKSMLLELYKRADKGRKKGEEI